MAESEDARHTRETAPPELLAAYQDAATEDAREQAATRLSLHYRDIPRPPLGSVPWLERHEAWCRNNSAFAHWHFIAGTHRAKAIAERIPSPYDRPLETPRDACLRYLWGHRHWSLDSLVASSGGFSARRGEYGGGFAVDQRGDQLHVVRFNDQECTERFAVRALWRELFGDGTGRQMTLFEGAGVPSCTP